MFYSNPLFIVSPISCFWIRQHVTENADYLQSMVTVLNVKDIVFSGTIIGIATFSIGHKGCKFRDFLHITNAVARNYHTLLINIDDIVTHHPS